MSDNKTISNGCVALFHYRLTDDDGQEIDSSAEDAPMAYLHGSGNIVPGLEKQLEGRGAGDKLKATVAPEDAYGVDDGSPPVRVPLSNFPEEVEIQVGMAFAATDDRGEQVPVWVIGLDGDDALLTHQHPLAGKTLHFEVEILEVREASAEERQHGHAHGDGGHHH